MSAGLELSDYDLWLVSSNNRNGVELIEPNTITGGRGHVEKMIWLWRCCLQSVLHAVLLYGPRVCPSRGQCPTVAK